VQGFSESTDSAYKESGQIIMESVTNIRTVVSFSNEKMIEEFYAEKLKKPYEIVNKKGNYSGLVNIFHIFILFT
jgi:ATP-binding cassette subfamily B (MDR/TAP) protein 1